MFTAALIVAAVVVLCKDWLRERYLALAASGKLRKVDVKHVAAAALLAVAAMSWGYQPPVVDGRPAPAPEVPAGPLTLRGLFVGPTAAEDATALCGLCDALADYVQADGELAKPRLTTGWAVADLRSAAREIRLGGESIGARQPLVRDAVHRYLDRDDVLGKAGGPLSARDRERWVVALRDVARAAEAAIQ